MLAITILGVLVLAIVVVTIVSMTKKSQGDPALKYEEQENRKTPGNQKITPTG